MNSSMFEWGLTACINYCLIASLTRAETSLNLLDRVIMLIKLHSLNLLRNNCRSAYHQQHSNIALFDTKICYKLSSRGSKYFLCWNDWNDKIYQQSWNLLQHFIFFMKIFLNLFRFQIVKNTIWCILWEFYIQFIPWQI